MFWRHEREQKRKGQRKQRDKGRKIVKYKQTLKRCVEKHSELPKQMYSNTLFDIALWEMSQLELQLLGTC